MQYSEDQARARDRILAVLHAAGVDVAEAALLPDGGGPQPTLAVIGKAGSGKTMLLADLVRGLVAAGVEPISTDYESRKSRTKRTLAVLAPTNKAASVLRGRGVPATTIHRILYTPLYHPDYEAIAEWLTGKGERPKVEGLSEAALDRAMAFYRQHPSMPGALASAGLRGSDFIKGWKRRDEPLDIGLIDEASMLDARQYADLRELFSHAGPLRRPGAARAGRRDGRDGVRRPARDRAAHAQPGAPAGGGQPDPRPRACARRSRPRASPASRRWSTGRRRATAGWWWRRGSMPGRWRGRRCWSGATRRGCG